MIALIRKIIASVLLAGAAFAMISRPVMARPPYSFGGGERVIHINENTTVPANATPNHTNATHVNTTPQGYEYGSFLGVLTVERLGRTVNIYGGATMESMELGAGHFSFTGKNVGNTALIGHNRGARNGFFSFVRLLRVGDIITLDMGGIVRTYAVSFTTTVYETDFSYLQQFGTNRLTLVTCVEYVRNQRRVAVLDEI